MFYTLIGTIVFALDIVAIVSLLLGRGTVGHKVLWIVVILLLPVIGMLAYYLLGRSTATHEERCRQRRQTWAIGHRRRSLVARAAPVILRVADFPGSSRTSLDAIIRESGATSGI